MKYQLIDASAYRLLSQSVESGDVVLPVIVEGEEYAKGMHNPLVLIPADSLKAAGFQLADGWYPLYVGTELLPMPDDQEV